MSSRGLDAFLAEHGKAAGGVKGPGRRRAQKEDWAGEEEEEDNEEDEVSGERGGPLSGAVSSEGEDDEGEGVDSEEEEEEGAVGEGAQQRQRDGPTVNKSSRRGRAAPRARDLESIHSARWKSQQGIEAEEAGEEQGDGEGQASSAVGVALSKPLVITSRSKRARAEEGGGEGREEGEEAERQRRMRKLFDRRDDEQLETFSMKSDQSTGRGRAAGVDDGPRAGAPVNDDEEEEAKRRDPWWAQQSEKDNRGVEGDNDTVPSPSAAVSSPFDPPLPVLPRAAPRRSSAFVLRPWSERGAKQHLLPLLLPGETPLIALKRLGHSPSATRSASSSSSSSSFSATAAPRRLVTRQKNRRTQPSTAAAGHSQPVNDGDAAMKDQGGDTDDRPPRGAMETTQQQQQRTSQHTAPTPQLTLRPVHPFLADHLLCWLVCVSLCWCVGSASFARLTDLCAQSVEEGWLDVYQCTWQQLMTEQKRREEEEKNNKDREGEAEQDDGGVEYITKATIESSSQQGPFTAQELMEAVREGQVTAGGVVRKVGETTWQAIRTQPWWTAVDSH